MSDRVEEAREKFEHELDDVRRSLDEEWGWAPRGGRWIAPVTAVAVGFLAAGALKRSLRRFTSLD